MDKNLTPGEPEPKPRTWRSLVALAAGMIFLIVLALLMVWLGTLI